MKKFLHVITNLDLILSGFFFCGMLLSVTLNVILRYIFRLPSAAFTELSVLCVCWAVFLGIESCYRKNQHIAMEYLISHLPYQGKLFAQRIIMLINAILFAYLTYLAFQYSSATLKSSDVLKVPYQYIYGSAGIGFGLMTISSIHYLWQSFFQRDAFNARYGMQEKGE